MNSSMQSALVEIFSEKELRELLDNLYMDDTVDMLEELPANLVTRILNVTPQNERNIINQLLNYPDDSAGSIMTTEYVDLSPEWTVAKAMAHIKKTGIHKETIYTCYVTWQRKLIGIVSAKDLMTSDDNTLIKDIMETELISVSTHTDQEEVAGLFRKYENAFAAIPLLVSFIPMLMDTGGNCGSQSSTLIIRGLALDEVRFSDFFRVVFKEFQISIIVGIVLATANGLRIFIEYHNLGLALVIALSLIVTVTLSKIIGCTLPLFAKKIGLDPALMASPLITTLVDTCSIIVYFNIATTIFKI